MSESIPPDESIHIVDRVLSFLSSRPNWDPLAPSLAGECVPPPFGWGGGGGHTLAGEFVNRCLGINYQ
jgi:hypothetical protein